MAGGQTPRDKMIGMMYLVLTALLALNVSTSVLKKFVLISKSLDQAVTQKKELIDNTVLRIEDVVKKTGNRKNDVETLNKAKQVKEEGDKVLTILENYKKQFIAETDGIDEYGQYKGEKDIDKAPEIMIQRGEGVKLQKILNEYSQFIREKVDPGNKKGIAKTIKNLALDGKNIEVFKHDEEQNTKDFSELNFGSNTPMVGGLASLSQLQSDVTDIEIAALEELARQVGAEDIKFDKVIAMVKPESNIVAAGTKYAAELFLAASSSAISPKMKVNNSEIPVKDGFGHVEFLASSAGGNYNDQGLIEKYFDASIIIKLPDGRDSSITNKIKYFVSKPVIQIQSASVQALYRNCGNDLNVQVPALGIAYLPSFKVDGGEAISGAEKGFVTIIPNSIAKEVILTVYSNGNEVGKQSFKTKGIPSIEIKAVVDGKIVDSKNGIPQCPNSIKLTVIADESFKSFLPNDSRFRVNKAEITLVRSGRGVTPTQTVGESINTSQMRSQAKSGDIIVIEIKQVQRMNFKNQIEEFTKYERIVFVPIK